MCGCSSVVIWAGSWGSPSWRLCEWKTWEISLSSARSSWSSTSERRPGENQKNLPVEDVPEKDSGLKNSSKSKCQESSVVNVSQVELLVSSLFLRSWLYDLCRGIEFEPVKPRQLPKSIGCSKNFPGKTCLATKQHVNDRAVKKKKNSNIHRI